MLLSRMGFIRRRPVIWETAYSLGSLEAMSTTHADHPGIRVVYLALGRLRWRVQCSGSGGEVKF